MQELRPGSNSPDLVKETLEFEVISFNPVVLECTSFVKEISKLHSRSKKHNEIWIESGLNCKLNEQNEKSDVQLQRVEAKMSDMQEKIDNQFRKNAATMSEIRAGLGQGLEQLCASWLASNLMQELRPGSNYPKRPTAANSSCGIRMH